MPTPTRSPRAARSLSAGFVATYPPLQARGPRRAPYERSGDVSQVVFPCGWLLDADGDTLRVYYGAADTSVCVAGGSLTALLAWLARHS